MNPETLAKASPVGNLAIIPPAAKAILIRSIYDLAPARTVRLRLLEVGIKRSERSVMNWLKAIRMWLEFPDHYPCTSSEAYRASVQSCRRRNGTPTAERIEAGWRPVSVVDSGSR